jgi:hypothetical protein
LPVVGRWHGYVENQEAPWDELLLEINGANGSGLCGTLKVGSAAPPAPATNPGAAYPPGAQSARQGWKLIPGYALTLENGTTDGTRVRFDVSPTESYHSWCQLQTPYDWDRSSCGCVPRTWPSTGDLVNDVCTFIDLNNGKNLTFSCSQANLCGGLGSAVCTCNASACGATDDARISFDLRITGDTAEGSETGNSTSRLYFTRVP